MPPGGAPPAHAWGPTSPHGLLFCLLQSHAIRAKGYLFDRLNRADVERHMLRSTKNGSRARRFPFANSSCHPWRDLRVPAMMDVSGVLGISAQLAGRIASWWLASTRAEVLVAPEHNPDDSTPARYGGRASLVFYLIYLRKRNTTVLDAAHRAVFCCLLPLSDPTKPLD